MAILDVLWLYLAAIEGGFIRILLIIKEGALLL